MKRGKVKGKFALYLTSFLRSYVTKRQEGDSCIFYLVLLLLSDFCEFSGETFIRRFKVEYLSWIVIYPFFNVLYLLFGKLCKVSSFRNKSSYLSVYSLITTTFPRRVGVTIVHLCSIAFAVYGFFYSLAI